MMTLVLIMAMERWFSTIVKGYLFRKPEQELQRIHILRNQLGDLLHIQTPRRRINTPFPFPMSKKKQWTIQNHYLAILFQIFKYYSQFCR